MAAVAIAAIVAVPLVAVLSSLAVPVPEIWAHLWRTQLVELVVNSLLLVAGVGAGTLVLGTALAWLVVAHHFPGRRFFEWALILPLAIPAYVIGFAFLGLLDFTGPVQTWLRQLGVHGVVPELRSYWGVVTMMTLVFYPYVYLLGRAAFREQGATTMETARSLGISRARAFRDVALPMARPSLAAGTALAMMEALADFGTVATFGYRTLTEAIYRVWYGMFDRVAATQLASMLMFLALALLLVERSLRGRARFTQSHRRGPGIAPLPLAGWRRWAATAASALVLALAFGIPVAQLVAWAVGPGEGAPRSAGFVVLLGNTVTVATLAAALACALAIVLAYARRLERSPGVQAATRFATMGYALPGSVIAVGVLLPLAQLDRLLARAADTAFGHPLGLVLTGSLAGLVFAYVVRFLAVAFQTVEASLGKIPGSLDDAARSLGAGVAGTLRRVHVPLLRGGLLTALVLVFVETMKEMPATLLLRPLGFDTLAVDIWERTSESLWAEAAVPALALVAAGLVPVVLAIRLTGGARTASAPAAAGPGMITRRLRAGVDTVAATLAGRGK